MELSFRRDDAVLFLAALAVGLIAMLVGLLTGSGGVIIGLVVGLLLTNVVFSMSEDASGPPRA